MAQNRYYLDQSVHSLDLALNSVSIDFQYHNPICSLDDSYPQFMVCTAEYFIRKTDILIEPIIASKDLKHKKGSYPGEDDHKKSLLFLTLQTINNSI